MAATDAKGMFASSSIIDGSPIATLVVDGDHRITHWNGACEQLTGIRGADMIGTTDQWRAFYPNPRPILADLIINGSLEGDIERFYRGKYRHSEIIDNAFEAEDFFPHLGHGGRWLFFTAAAIRDGAGEIIGAIETLQDITERRRAEAALSDKEAFLAEIVAGSPVATMVIDSEHYITHWNHACEVMTGMSAKETVGTRNQWRAFYPQPRPIMCDLVLDGASCGALDKLYHGRYRASQLVEGGYEAEDFFPHFGEQGRWLFFTAAPLRNAAGEVVGAIETLQDVSERRHAEEALRLSEERFRRLSVTDSLTGLFNSRHLHERLQIEMERARRYGRPLSMLVLDADNFKQINDTWGHLIGDSVLQMLAHSINQCLRRTDSAYRYGGEEFVVLMPEAADNVAAAVAERLRHEFSLQRVPSGSGEEVTCTVSIGIAEFLPDETPKRFIQRADEATYAAKRAGKNRVVIAD